MARNRALGPGGAGAGNRALGHCVCTRNWGSKLKVQICRSTLGLGLVRVLSDDPGIELIRVMVRFAKLFGLG